MIFPIWGIQLFPADDSLTLAKRNLKAKETESMSNTRTSEQTTRISVYEVQGYMFGNHLLMLFLQIWEIMLEELSFDLMLNNLQLYSQLFGLWGMLPVIISGEKNSILILWWIWSPLCSLPGNESSNSEKPNIKMWDPLLPTSDVEMKAVIALLITFDQKIGQDMGHIFTPLLFRLILNLNWELMAAVVRSIHGSRGYLLLIIVTNIYSRQGCVYCKTFKFLQLS